MATGRLFPMRDQRRRRLETAGLIANLRIISCLTLDMFARLINILIMHEFVEEFVLGEGGSLHGQRDT